MSPADLRALLGKDLMPNTPIGTPATTIRFRVLGFGTTELRVRSTRSHVASTIPYTELDGMLQRGELLILDPLPATRA